jgi:D-glycero-beta-D-manno-heptose 1-phosphate adenylyltransferase
MICSSLSELRGIAEVWRTSGQRIVFTNGVFDILHLGHVTYLEASRALGDRLVVAVNSDESVRRLGKGPERPVNAVSARAGVLAALRCVDAVVVFGEDTPYDVIREVMPDVLVKGGDYDPAETDPKSRTYIVGSDLVRAAGGRVEVINLVDGYSTTSIVAKLRDK